jgi:hypothetical protein
MPNVMQQCRDYKFIRGCLLHSQGGGLQSMVDLG